MGPGLYNMGNTCFLNATVQCLSYLPPLAQHLLQGVYSQVNTTQRRIVSGGRAERSDGVKRTLAAAVA